MNSVNLIGGLTRDPEVKYTSGAEPIAVCTFTVAIIRMKDGADFPRIKCFGKTAESCGKYLAKGSKVGIVGRIQTGSYEKDGQKFYTTDVIADRVEFLNWVETGGSEQKEMDIPPQFATIKEDVPF